MALVLPRTLTAGTPENVNHVQENFEAIRDFVNASSVEEANIADGSVTNTKLGADAVTTDKILAGTVADTDLASPNNAVWRTLLNKSGLIQGSLPVGTYGLGEGLVPLALGSNGYPILRLTPADYAVDGKTTKLRCVLWLFPNSVAPAATFQFGLASFTSTGGAANVMTVAGGADIGSPCLVPTPTGSTETGDVGATIDFPTDAYYIPYGTISGGTTAANSRLLYNFAVQISHV